MAQSLLPMDGSSILPALSRAFDRQRVCLLLALNRQDENETAHRNGHIAFSARLMSPLIPHSSPLVQCGYILMLRRANLR
ncbi:hypothetical protein QUA79_00650 [Microcoleus sp. F8-D1]